jgi:hypothetical protein
VSETISFILKIILKQGIWIFGFAWLLAVGGWALFDHQHGSVNSNAEGLALMKRKAWLGVIILVLGILIAL